MDAGANVLLARNAYDVVFDRTENLDGLTAVAPSQAAVDLITGPGRIPAEAEALLDWMQANEAQCDTDRHADTGRHPNGVTGECQIGCVSDVVAVARTGGAHGCGRFGLVSGAGPPMVWVTGKTARTEPART